MKEEPFVRTEVRIKKKEGWNLHIDSFFFFTLFVEPYASKVVCTVPMG